MAPGGANDTRGEPFCLVLVCDMIVETEKEKQIENVEIVTADKKG